MAGACRSRIVGDGLADRRRPWTVGQLAAQWPDHEVRRYLAFAQWLERQKDEAAIGLSAASEADHHLDRGVFLDDRDELLEFLPHQLERNALVGLDAAVDPAGILLREEALGDDRVEIEIGPDGREQDRHDEERMVERPAERVLVAAQHGVEAPLGHAVKAALLVSLPAPEP